MTPGGEQLEPGLAAEIRLRELGVDVRWSLAGYLIMPAEAANLVAAILVAARAAGVTWEPETVVRGPASSPSDRRTATGGTGATG